MRTLKEYSFKKQNKVSFDSRWNSIYNDIIFPVTQRITMRTISQDLTPIQPMAAPTEFPIYYQHGVTEEINFPFWKIKVIFKNNIE